MPDSPRSNKSNDHDVSNSTTTSTTTHVTFPLPNSTIDVSFTDLSMNTISDISFVSPIFVSHTRNVVTDGSGYVVTDQEGQTVDSSYVLYDTFDTTNPELYDPNIQERLVETISMYDDETDPSGQNSILVRQIQTYASQIQCDAFHGKGSVDDYAALFEAASKIAHDTKQMELNVDIEGFSDFGRAADELSQLFQSFTIKLQNVNIINDVAFLTSISAALGKIVNLTKVFGKFKETILATSTIAIPKSTYDTKIVLEGVMDEVACAMNYIGYFVDASSNPSLVDAQLSNTEKEIIHKAVDTIDHWNVICDQGISVGMAQDPNIKYIVQSSRALKQTTSALQNATEKLRMKLHNYLR